MALLRGDLERARHLYREPLRERFEAGDAQVVPTVLDGLAWVATSAGDAELAAVLIGAAQAAAESNGAALFPIWKADRERAAAEARAALGEARFDVLIRHGRSLPLDEAVRLALQENNEE